MAEPVNRRRVLKGIAAAPFAGSPYPGPPAHAAAAPSPARVRPGDPLWPSAEHWAQLGRNVGGRLIKVQSPLAACVGQTSEDCAALFRTGLKNPYFIGDEPGLTQTLGWVGAWTSQPSVYAVAAESAADVSAAVNFGRTHNLRLVVKGGAHSYQGTSNAADSLLIWTRRMSAITLHDAFVGAGCDGSTAPQAAVSVEAGAIWGHVYQEVMVKAGRYAQGGGCLTVGVAGFLNGGGFGSLSKQFGIGAASIIEAEVVTADGEVRLANACTNPDLFWALKGGGGGFGVVTRVTLRTHAPPNTVGGVFAAIRATSDDAWRRLVAKTVDFYHEALFNPHWGEQLRFQPGNVLAIQTVFQNLSQPEAEALWRPFFDWVRAAPQDFDIVMKPLVVAGPGRVSWDPAVLRRIPGVVVADDRPGAPEGNIFWAGDGGQVGWLLYAMQSVWLDASLLEADRRGALVDALIAAAKHAQVELHVNKGLAGGQAEAIAAAKDTAMNPAVAEAFALAIVGAGAPPAYPGVPGHEPDEAQAQTRAAAVTASMDELRRVAPRAGSYVWETDYFQTDWQEAFWGDNYAQLRAIKAKYDPGGLFFAHHAVGSEDWSADGFTRLR
jgi:FAD/FMN-containing dehydrogenase